MEISNGNWPADMLIEILLKLPVKSIIRFKCVAKTWCHLFQNPTFVSQHLSISKKNKQHLVAYYRNGLNGDGYNNKIDLRLFVDEALVSYHDLRQQLPSDFASIYIFEFLVDNGLFCLFDDRNFRITLWNPATRVFRILPNCNQNLPPKIDTFGNIFGFGLDTLSNDYKVIYMRTYLDLETNRQEPTQYSVYSMSTDSWRIFKEEDVKFLEHHSVGNNFNNACVNGVYYWEACKSGGGDVHSYVLAFNLATEVFQLIVSPLPKRPFGQLLPLHNCIAIWDTLFQPGVEISNDVWVLNDEGHWTKVLKIEPVLQVYKMFGFWRNGKVLVESVSGQLLLYDLESEEAKELGIQTMEGGDLLCVHTYEESLVAVE